MTHILPTLQTPRLTLRAAQRDDLDALQRIWNEQLVRRYLFDDSPVDNVLASSVLESCISVAGNGYGLWILSARASQAVVGCASLLQAAVAAEHEPRLAGLLEPMVALEPQYWGMGYASEALAAVLDHAFRALAVPTVSAVNDVPNAASERMLLRANFSPLSEVDGPRYRMRTYILSRSRWLETIGVGVPCRSS